MIWVYGNFFYCYNFMLEYWWVYVNKDNNLLFVFIDVLRESWFNVRMFVFVNSVEGVDVIVWVLD